MGSNNRQFDFGPEDLPIKAIKLMQKLLPDYSYGQLRRLFRRGSVSYNNETIEQNQQIRDPGTIKIDEDQLKQRSLTANRKIKPKYVHENENYVVINKFAGLVVAPGPGHGSDTLLNGVLNKYPEQINEFGQPESWGLVHRLDRDTSGVLVVALKRAAYENLCEQFKQRVVKKVYRVLVHGSVEPDQGQIDQPILTREVYGRRRQVVDPGGKPALSEFTVLQRWGDFTELAVTIKTGRTHQIRVHMAHLGHPVCGDRVYGEPDKFAPRQMLHASQLEFTDPVSTERVSFECEVPADYRRLTRRFARWQEKQA